jgi:beta-fructofuranosidase
MYYKGYYHLFYQYNPEAPVWGNLTWGHAVSKDLVHWLYLEDAMKPDQWYDVNGVWSGSATIDPDGIPFILYTGLLIESTSVSRISASLAQQWSIIDNDIFHFEQATLDFKDL